MTNISNIHAAIDTIISTNLSTYIKLPNPYTIADNPELIMGKSYIIGFGGGTNTKRFQGCQLSIDRTFSITLINQVTSLETDANNFENIVKSLMEDQFIIIKAFENDADLSGYAMNGRYISDDGVEFLGGEQSKFIMISSNFSAEYRENL